MTLVFDTATHICRTLSVHTGPWTVKFLLFHSVTFNHGQSLGANEQSNRHCRRCYSALAKLGCCLRQWYPSHRTERISSEGRRRRKWLGVTRWKEFKSVVKQNALKSDDATVATSDVKQELMDHWEKKLTEFSYTSFLILFMDIVRFLRSTQLFEVLRYKSEGCGFDS